MLPPEAQAIAKKTKDDIRNKGYIEKLDQPPRAEYVRARMKQRENDVRKAGRAANAQSLGYQKITESSIQELPFKVGKVPDGIVATSSENFVFRGDGAVKRLYTQTEFGALLIDEQDNTQIQLEEPNVQVGGLPATLVHQKHAGGKWATVLYATNGRRVFIVESDKRLEGNKQKAFLSFAESLIASAR